MLATRSLAAAFLAAALLPGTAAYANTCHAGRQMCSTSMPVGGYCECFSHGQTESGTVEGASHHHPHHMSGAS